MTRLSMLRSCALFTLLAPACGGMADPDAAPGDEQEVATRQAAVIQTVGTSNPVGVDTYDWNGNLAHYVVFDGNAQTSASGSTLTYKVGSSVSDASYKTLTFSRSNGKLVVTATSYLTLNGVRTPFSHTVAETTPNQGTVLKSGSLLSTSVCTAGPLGPFVRPAAGCYSPLLDQRLLAKVPSPKTLNGAAPSDLGKAISLALTYRDLYANHLLLWDTFRYRAELNGTGFTRQTVYDALHEYLTTTDAAMHHHHINHSAALGDTNEDWTDLGVHAAFLDGHRAYMNQFETWVLAHPAYKMPYQRTPAWMPESVPVEFQAEVNKKSGGGGIPSQYAAGTICGTYNTAGTPVRLNAMVALGGGAFNGWHGSIHTYYGGIFGPITTSATTPIFWPWHTAVDAVWANLQRCYLDDGASL